MFSLQLPEGVVSHFTSNLIGQERLFKEELMVCEEYEESRLIDFVRGRYCGHQCLDEFGVQHTISRNSFGVPLWPTGFVGSISHTDGIAGAIVGKAKDYLSLGLDIERIGRIREDDWRVLFTHDEIQLLKGFAVSIRQEFSTLFFSAKETFFKLQFVITNKGLEFDDVEIHLENDQLFVTSHLLKNWGPIAIYYCMEQECIVTFGAIRNM